MDDGRVVIKALRENSLLFDNEYVRFLVLFRIDEYSYPNISFVCATVQIVFYKII